MCKEYDHQLEKVKAIKNKLKDIDVKKNDFEKGSTAFKILCVYLVNLISLDAVIIRLLESIKNYNGEENNKSIYEDVIVRNLFKNFEPKAIAKRIVQKGHYKINYFHRCNILHFFVLTGCTEAVQILLEAGAEINQVDNIDMTPLCKVVESFGFINTDISTTKDLIKKDRLIKIREKYIRMIKLLIEYQADVDRTIHSQNDESPFPTTLNELFRLFEAWIGQKLILDNEAVVLLHEMSAIILCNSRFKDNFEEHLQLAQEDADDQVQENEEEGDEVEAGEETKYDYNLTDKIIADIRASMDSFIHNNPVTRNFTIEACREKYAETVTRHKYFAYIINKKYNDSPAYSSKKRKHEEIEEKSNDKNSDINDQNYKRAKPNN